VTQCDETDFGAALRTIVREFSTLPLFIISWQRAITLLYLGKVEVVEGKPGKVGADTLFMIGSCSKSLTTLLPVFLRRVLSNPIQHCPQR
jgi:hypothetical protein